MTRPDKAAPRIPDLVRRDFTASAVNRKWCGDLTEVPTGEGKLYLATVEDRRSRSADGSVAGHAERVARGPGSVSVRARSLNSQLCAGMSSNVMRHSLSPGMQRSSQSPGPITSYRSAPGTFVWVTVTTHPPDGSSTHVLTESTTGGCSPGRGRGRR